MAGIIGLMAALTVYDESSEYLNWGWDLTHCLVAVFDGRPHRLHCHGSPVL